MDERRSGAGWDPACSDSGGRTGRARSPVDRVLAVQVFQAAQDLCRVEQGSLLLEAGVPHVVDVELQVTPVHDGQNQAQRVLGLIGVGQVDLGAQDSTAVRFWSGPPLPRFFLKAPEVRGGLREGSCSSFTSAS